MESDSGNPPLIVIVGQTATGKSALGLELAARFNGEIICADSRTVYKEMDIGTAKPSRQDRARVPHHLLSIARPDYPISAADFQRKALRAIQKIQANGKLPFLIGGSGLYVDAVMYNFSFRSASKSLRRKELENKTVKELHDILRTEGIDLPSNPLNQRHLVRQLETRGQSKTQTNLRDHTLVLGIEIENQVLKARIHERVKGMFESGLELEVMKLVAKYGWNCRALQTIGYQEFRPYFEGTCTKEELMQSIERNTVKYAKRQKTWFKRNKDIHWICKVEESIALITSFLNK